MTVSLHARSMSNWLWTTFTRSNPACDIDGIGAKVRQQALGLQWITCD